MIILVKEAAAIGDLAECKFSLRIFFFNPAETHKLTHEHLVLEGKIINNINISDSLACKEHGRESFCSIVVFLLGRKWLEWRTGTEILSHNHK